MIRSLCLVLIAFASTFAGLTHGEDAHDDTDSLSAHVWYWKTQSTASKTVEIDRQQDYQLVFAKDGTLTIKADCNRASGTFKVDAEKNLAISVGPSTSAACSGNSRGEQLLQLLAGAQKFLLAGDILIVILKDESVLGFRAPNLIDKCGEQILQPISLSDTIDRNISSELDKTLVGFVTSPALSAPGVSMLVITPKGQYLKAVGVSDAETCARLDPGSPFQIGSNTKMMTAAIIYQLQEKRKLSTSDKFGKYLPEIAAKLPYGNEITIEMLLTHTSGLLDYFDIDTGDGGIGGGIKNKAILQRGYTPEALIDLVATSGKSNFKPAETGKWKYSNTGYILLGMIIEKVTKKSYEENLKSRIFKPLGLKKTYLQKGQPAKGALPQAYYQGPFTYTTSEWNASQGWAAGAVVSTSQEFALFLKSLFTGRLFKQKTTLGLMLVSLPAEDKALGGGTKYGHGMLHNAGVLGHGGQTLGFQSDGGYIPEKDITIVMWSNSAASSVNRLAVPGLAKLLLGSK